MGYIAHHAIVVTSWDADAVDRAHWQAGKLDLNPSGVTPAGTNGYASFLVPPDGSKEGWEASDEGDKRREHFKEWLRSQRHDDSSSPLEWVEVRYGSDDRAAIVTDNEWAA